MTPRVILQPEASAELAHAARWYEQQHADLGLRFLDAVDDLVRRIERWPRAAALVAELPDDLPVRTAPVKAFPYHVAYLATDEVIHILAIAHDHRRPRYWMGPGIAGTHDTSRLAPKVVEELLEDLLFVDSHGPLVHRLGQAGCPAHRVDRPSQGGPAGAARYDRVSIRHGCAPNRSTSSVAIRRPPASKSPWWTSRTLTATSCRNNVWIAAEG